jgi:hypothetical protein
MNKQCTYLGYVLLEAPPEYALHGPLLSINWLRLCPHLVAQVRSHAVQRRLFIVLMTAAHISPNVFFPPKVPQQHTRIISYSTSNIIHTYYTSHLYAYLHRFILCVLFTYSLPRIFMAGWLPSAPFVRYSDKA